MSISEGLARNVLSASVNGEVWDTNRPITTDSSVTLHTWNDKEGKMSFWHSSAHIMAEALEALYPGVKFGIGPAIDNGFYYDIDLGDRVISSDELPKIEKKMKELASQKLSFNRKTVSKKEAIAYFTEKGDDYKLELLEGLEDGNITFYNKGNFTSTHSHWPSTWGFVYTVQACENCSPLIFDQSNLMDQPVEITPKTGQMLLFPAWLNHQVFPFYGTEEERVTISGNIEFFQDLKRTTNKSIDNMEKQLEKMEYEVEQIKKIIQKNKEKT